MSTFGVVDVTGEGWFVAGQGEDTPGGLPLNSTSVAFENARAVKSGAGTLFGLSGYSSAAGALFILVFDAQSLPPDGAVPMVIIPVASTSGFSADFGQWGRSFRSGIQVCNSTTATTKTLSSANCWIDAQYI